MAYWLVKQEPTAYAWETFVADGSTEWTGVRNAQARINLAAMQVGDRVFYYHSNVGLEIVGLAIVTRAAQPDPTADDPKWISVKLMPEATLCQPVSLATLKADPRMKDLLLIRHTRLSVMPVGAAEAKAILDLAGGTVPLPSGKSKRRKA